jgi:hypothetical protein
MLKKEKKEKKKTRPIIRIIINIDEGGVEAPYRIRKARMARVAGQTKESYKIDRQVEIIFYI